MDIFEDICKNVFKCALPSFKIQPCEIIEKVERILRNHNLNSNDLFVQKISELHERLKLQKNIIILGKSFTGKTTAYQVNLKSQYFY